MYVRVPALLLGLVCCIHAIYMEEEEFYCNLPCFKNKEKISNVICSNFPCLPSTLCGQLHRRLPLNDEEKDYVVDLHNTYRNIIAAGEQLYYKSASDMKVMSYDKELEFLAACWSNQCWESPRPSDGRDRCRATSKFAVNGQNHWASAYENLTIDWSEKKYIKEAVDHWFSGVHNATGNIISSYKYDPTESYEFFTQMIWSDTYLIGCGRTRFSVRGFLGLNIVCNYGPTGNVLDEPVYHEGRPCTMYENQERNTKYPALCGTIRPKDEDVYMPPFPLVGSRNSINFVAIMGLVHAILMMVTH